MRQAEGTACVRRKPSLSILARGQLAGLVFAFQKQGSRKRAGERWSVQRGQSEFSPPSPIALGPPGSSPPALASVSPSAQECWCNPDLLGCFTWTLAPGALETPRPGPEPLVCNPGPAAHWRPLSGNIFITEPSCLNK